jgi:hypothetical protein
MELSDATEKTPAIPGIDPGTFRLVAQCLNDYGTPGPLVRTCRKLIFKKFYNFSIYFTYFSVSDPM